MEEPRFYERNEIDRLMASPLERRPRIELQRNVLAQYRVAAGLPYWKGLASRSGLSSWNFTDPQALVNNFTAETWLRCAMAVGAHPFTIATVFSPLPEPRTLPQDVNTVWNQHRKVWGWNNSEIDHFIRTGEARIYADRQRLAILREEAGLSAWKHFAQRCGLSVQTLQVIESSNIQSETVMRIALGLGRHPYEFLRVEIPQSLDPAHDPQTQGRTSSKGQTQRNSRRPVRRRQTSKGEILIPG